MKNAGYLSSPKFSLTKSPETKDIEPLLINDREKQQKLSWKKKKSENVLQFLLEKRLIDHEKFPHRSINCLCSTSVRPKRKLPFKGGACHSNPIQLLPNSVIISSASCLVCVRWCSYTTLGLWPGNEKAQIDPVLCTFGGKVDSGIELDRKSSTYKLLKHAKWLNINSHSPELQTLPLIVLFLSLLNTKMLRCVHLNEVKQTKLRWTFAVVTYKRKCEAFAHVQVKSSRIKTH